MSNEFLEWIFSFTSLSLQKQTLFDNDFFPWEEAHSKSYKKKRGEILWYGNSMGLTYTIWGMEIA